MCTRATASLLLFYGAALLVLLCPSCGLDFDGAVWSPLNVAADPLPCDLSNPAVCVINSTVKSSSSLELTFEGDVEVQGDDVAIISTEGFVSITASGKVSLHNAAGVTARSDIILTGRNLEIATALHAGGHLALGVWMPSDPCDSIQISGPTITGASLTIHCLGGIVGVSRTTLTVASDAEIDNGITVEAKNITIDTLTHVEAHGLTVEAQGDVSVEAGRIGGLPDNGTSGVLNTFRAFTHGRMVLGSENGHWTVRKFEVAAQDILFAAGHTTETLDPICHNQKSRRTERCTSALEAWPSQGQDPRPGANVDGIAAAATDADVAFDFVAVAREALEIKEGARAYGSAIFLCAGGDVTIGELATLDASWRGCSAENGAGRGDTNSTVGAVCGAGGASHLGRGGHGVQYGTLSAHACANPGLQYDMTPGFLPTQTASGGGCGVTRPSCDKETGIYSHGGGLIWIDVQQQLSIQKGTQLLADGNRGKQLAETENTSSTVSGGGAGGQVFLYAKALTVNEESPITVSAQGGAIMCSNSVAGGAGGGGFVGLGLLGDRQSSVTDGLHVNVDSGDFGEYCSKFNFPQTGARVVRGTAGLAASLVACDAGQAGIFCAACPLGRWNSEGGNLCYACENKPLERAEYTKLGWTSPHCPYKCIPGVPDVASNPDCLDVPAYIFAFFGGYTGLLLILGLLVLVIAFLLWRRARFGMGPVQSSKPSESFIRPRIGRCRGLPVRLCNYLLDAVAVFSSHACPDDLLWFDKERLPFHVCRVFMCGNNSRQSPWGFDESVPPSLEDLVVSERWALFVREANALASVRRCELLVQRFLQVIYPPAAPVFAARCRRKRAKKLRLCTHVFSEGAGSHSTIWRPIRARGTSGNGTGVLAMAFGFDSGSTLGYVDFFDFSRSQLDWAPVDLQQEVRFIVAHGDGSYMEPFSLDASDPLLQHLGNMGFGEAAVYGVVSVFNANARLLRRDALCENSTSPALQSLREGVDQCARKCGLEGLVHVLVVPQHSLRACRRSGSPEQARPGHFTMRSGHSFSDLIPSNRLSRQSSPVYATQQFGQLGSPASSVAHFGFAGSPTSSVPNFGTGDRQSSQEGPRSPAWYQQYQASRRLEWKLCLAFTDRSDDPATDDVLRRLRAVASAASARPSALTSPMLTSNLSEQLAWSLEQAAEARIRRQVTPRGRRLPAWYSCAKRMGSSLLARRISARSGSRMAPLASAILLLFVAIMFTDFLLFILTWSLLHSMRTSFLIIWLLIPPFAQPLSYVIGPLTLVFELPRLGRLFAAMVALGLLNAVVTMCIILVSAVDSWAFQFLGFLSVCMVKFALIICAKAHISSLEAALDLSFINTHQAQGACQLFSSELTPAAQRRGQRHSLGSLQELSHRSTHLDSGVFERQGTNSTSASTHSQQVLDDVALQSSPHRVRSGTFSLLMGSHPGTPLRANTPETPRPEMAMASLSSMSRKPLHGSPRGRRGRESGRVDPAPF